MPTDKQVNDAMRLLGHLSPTERMLAGAKLLGATCYLSGTNVIGFGFEQEPFGYTAVGVAVPSPRG